MKGKKKDYIFSFLTRMSRTSRRMKNSHLQKLEWKHLLNEKIALRMSHELKGFCFATIDCVVSSVGPPFMKSI